MAEDESGTHADALLGEIDEALGQTPVLTANQLDDLDRLRTELEAHCRSGDLERARGCRTLALKLIRSGAPAPE